jgi:hypothetical protein
MGDGKLSVTTTRLVLFCSCSVLERSSIDAGGIIQEIVKQTVSLLSRITAYTTRFLRLRQAKLSVSLKAERSNSVTSRYRRLAKRWQVYAF